MNTQTNNRTMPVNNRNFQVQERKSFSLAPVGVFPMKLISLAFIGTYTRTFYKNNVATTKDYEMCSLEYRGINLNTGEEFNLITDCIVSYVPDSRLYRHIIALNGGRALEQNTPLKTLLGKAALLEIVHSERNGKTYANAKSVNVINSNVQLPAQLKQAGAGLFYDLQQHDQAAYEQLNKKTRWMIENRSHEKGSDPHAQQQQAQGVGQAQGQQMPNASDMGAFMNFWQRMQGRG